MKNIILFMAVALTVPLPWVKAQNPNLERLNTYKIGFMTKKMNLTPQEAEKFWPVYNEYQKERVRIQKERIMLARDFNQNESSLTGQQLTDMGDRIVKLMTDESDLAVSFHEKIKKILPPAKVIRYYQAENQYKVQLLRELQGRQQPRKMDPDLDF
jgi:hypothetical protein